MPARSAGIVLFRTTPELEVLLVHPGGSFWRRRDEGAWQIPKGGVDPGEPDDAAARREAEEELGVALPGPLLELGEIRQAGGKVVAAFALEHDLDQAKVASNTFRLEWPPRSGRFQDVPEVDEARWMAIDEARRMILPSQAPLPNLLIEALAARPWPEKSARGEQR